MRKIKIAFVVAAALASLISAACRSPCHFEMRWDSSGNPFPYLSCNWRF